MLKKRKSKMEKTFIDYFPRQFYAMGQTCYLTTLKERKKPLAITAPLRYGGGSANINSCAINKQGVFRQISASNPPQRKAANRYAQP